MLFREEIKKTIGGAGYRPLRDNKEALVQALKRFERPIRTGTFDRFRREAAVSELKQLDKLDSRDLAAARRLMSFLSKGAGKKREVRPEKSAPEKLAVTEKKRPRTNLVRRQDDLPPNPYLHNHSSAQTGKNPSVPAGGPSPAGRRITSLS